MMAQKEPYAVLSEENTVLTFYYDENKESMGGMSVGPFNDYNNSGWYDNRTTITKVVFDHSMAECTTIMSTAFWFYDCSNLTEIVEIENLRTNNVTEMQFMFYGCSGLTSLDVSNFDTGKVEHMGYMFYNCCGLTSLDVSHFDTKNVRETTSMFAGCYGLTSLDVSNFDTGNMWEINFMFSNCSGLTSLDVSNFDTGNVENMCAIFYNCFGLKSLDVSNFNTVNVENMCAIFYNCYGLKSLDVSNFDTGKVTDMSWMFDKCPSLTSLDVSNFNTGNVKNMGCMFRNCPGLTSLDVSNFNTGHVENMDGMFAYCSGLTGLDVSNFNTGNVENMGGMFAYCSGLTSLDVSNFDTGKVTDMSGMFCGCSGLTSLDVSNFDTGNVTDMSWMFDICSGLTSLDVSNFDMGNVMNMNHMFRSCPNLTNIYCNDKWACSSNDDMFSGCSKLPGFNSDNIDVNYAHPGDGGYFTYKYEMPNAVGDTYWMTYYTDVRNIKADANTTVYTATLNSDATELTLTEVADKIVPRGQAVLLKSTVSNPLLYTQTGQVSEEAFATNSLIGTQHEKATADVEGTIYTLSVENGLLGFYQFAGTTLGAHEAFFAVPDADAVRYIRIKNISEPEGISEMIADDSLSQCYDLQGRRISQPQCGLYIVNGKKMVKQ